MKTKTTLLTLATIGMLSSCGSSSSNQTAADSTNQTSAADHRNADSTATVAEQDAQFAMDAADSGLAEVQLGEAALTKGSSPKVKEFGKMMVGDHTKANDELKAIAADKGISLAMQPSESKQKDAAGIISKSGKDFDKAYLAQMVKDHKKTVSLFEDGHKNVQDPDIRAFIDKTLPVLKTHLQHVEQLEKQN